MRTFKKLGLALGTVALVLICGILVAQTIKARKTHVELKGTSTVHDWTMDAYNAEFEGVLKGSTVEDVTFVLKVKDLKSDKRGMDENAYKALNAEAHPRIIFKADKLKEGIDVGRLTVNGVTKKQKINVNFGRTNGMIELRGTMKVDMRNFGVTPPSFFGGTVTTGDEVEVNFNLLLK